MDSIFYLLNKLYLKFPIIPKAFKANKSNIESRASLSKDIVPTKLIPMPSPDLCAIEYHPMERSMEHGKVKWFSQEKGYGFITSNAGVDHYCNVQGINGADLPSNGDEVSFESKAGSKGKIAVKVSITSRESVVTKNTDERVNCPECNKKIVPRMITYQGHPKKSVCPYCAATVKNFQSTNFIYFIIVAFVVCLLFVMP